MLDPADPPHSLAVAQPEGTFPTIPRRRKAAVTRSRSNYTPTNGVFAVELQPEDAGEAIGAVWREVDALRREEVPAEELERARNILEARLLRNMETVEGQANLLARWEAYGGWRLLGRYVDAIAAAAPADLARVAREYLAPDGRPYCSMLRPRRPLVEPKELEARFSDHGRAAGEYRERDAGRIGVSEDDARWRARRRTRRRRRRQAPSPRYPRLRFLSAAPAEASG